MFIKLLATKIVAKSFLGFSSKPEIIRMGFEPDSRPLSNWVLLSEKRATSAPDMSAEQNRSTKSNAIPKTIDTSMADIKTNKLEGSGSNF